MSKVFARIKKFIFAKRQIIYITDVGIKSKNLKANFWDLFKTATRNLFRHKTYFFGVIQPDGNIYPYWV